MYVRDLEDGCLLKPSPGWTWRVTTIKEIASHHKQEDGMAELAEAGIHHSVTLVNSRSPMGKENPGNPAVYTGKHKIVDTAGRVEKFRQKFGSVGSKTAVSKA